MPPAKYFLGIDIGGTFTDLVLAEETSHQVHNAKTLTTPARPGHRGDVRGAGRAGAGRRRRTAISSA